MSIVTWFVDVILHLDRNLNLWATSLGPWLYLILFAIVFCETGLVVTPFLPGDSLLFAVGALAATPGTPLRLFLIFILLCVAAIIGDALNYTIGAKLGRRVFSGRFVRFLNQNHLIRTQAFYEKHGGKTIILARFMPIIRTFAPFVAGIGHMAYRRFFVFNVVGAVAWVGRFLSLGYWFGNLPFVKKQFHLVIIAIVVLSFLPGVVEIIRARRAARTAGASSA